MYNELVKQLLTKHFGAARRSLTIGNDGAADGEADGGFDEEVCNHTYYYSLDNEKEITALCELLDMRHLVSGIDNLPELIQSIPEKSVRHTDAFACVSFFEGGGNWAAHFYYVSDIVYHPTQEGHVAATLHLEAFPWIMLSDTDGDDFFGFWRKKRTRKHTPDLDRDGLSYWMNKALKTSQRFREFAAEFFRTVAQEERLYILKDVARTISACGCFLPPVSFQELSGFRTPAELIRHLQTEPVNLSVDFNKVDLNVGYIMSRLAPYVDRRDYPIISRFTPHKIEDMLSLKLFYDGFTAGEFVYRYYTKVLRGEGDEWDIGMYARDYVQMCDEARREFRLCYELDELIRAHNELSYQIRRSADEAEFQKPLLKVPSKFDGLESAIRETGTTEFERIGTTERLFNEGEYQHNCVFSRRSQVRRDTASIYHWDHKGKSYTIQFAVDRKGRYSVKEVRARFNRSITEKHLRDLEQLLSGFCTVDQDLASAQAPAGAEPQRARPVPADDLLPEELPF